MGRPKMTRQAKWDALVARFKANVVEGRPEECWPQREDQYYYTMGREERYRPRTIAWVLAFPEKGIPQDPQRHWIGNKEGCTVDPCLNPEHLEIQGNVLKPDGRRAREIERNSHPGVIYLLDGQIFLKLSDGEKKVVWLDKEKKKRYLALSMTERAEWPRYDKPGVSAPIYENQNGVLVQVDE